MKKFIVFILIFTLCTPNCFAWSFIKKNKQQEEYIEEFDNQGNGYVGTLPDLTQGFETSEPKDSTPAIEKTKNFNSSNEIKPIPRDNPAFVNIILKTDKTSPYLNDINELLPQLENILFCIDNKYDTQKFNAKVNFFNQTVKYLQEKYADKPECNYESFKKLLTLSNHSQSVATLRSEAEKYRPYLAYTGAGYLYNDNVINEQLDYLKTEIENTIIILKEAK